MKSHENLLPMAGLHHVTAIASDPQRNLDFYVSVLGQRLVKQTVNFDAPQVYHFYFADGAGSPGTVLTFFPWKNARRGVRGAGESAAVAYSAPAGVLGAWSERLARHGVDVLGEETRFGEQVLSLLDPDGMRVEIVESQSPPATVAWEASPVPAEMALRGFHSVTLQVRDAAASAVVLVESFGWTHLGSEGNRHRYGVGGAIPGAIPGEIPGRIVDLLETPDAAPYTEGYGSIHHVAFRTPDEATERQWRELLLGERFNVTDVRDREYFRSIYFREPNGVLYEVATDTPGFATDEPLESLGSNLMLPAWFEPRRAEIAARLAPIRVPHA